MRRFLLLALTAGFFSTFPAQAFWGLRENEERQCRYEASKEKNEFSARKTYEYCKKTIRKRLREADKSMKRRAREVENYTNYCKAEDKKLLERIERQISIDGALTEEMNQRFLFAKVANKFCWEALDDFNSGRINSLPNLGQYD